MRWQPSKSERWNPSKRRTSKQKAQLAHLHAKHSSLNDENIPPPASSNIQVPNETKAVGDPVEHQLDVLKDRADIYERKFWNERKRNSRREMAITSLKNQYSSMSTEHKACQDRLQHLHSRHQKLTKQSHALAMRVRRAIAAKKLANDKADIEAPTEQHTFKFKEGGVITDASRSMVQDLVAKLDVPVASVNGAVNAVAAALGVRVDGRASSRSIRRIVGEAGVAAEVQLVDEMQQAEGVTLSGDGTTHKNVNYQSHHFTYALPGSQPVTRFAGVLHEVNHTSETQLRGWQSRISSLYASFNDVKLRQNKADPRAFPVKVKGMLSDHAEDQRKLARYVEEWKQLSERELRGEQALSVLPPNELLPHLGTMMDNLLTAAGGPEGWDALPTERKKDLGDTALRQLRINFGEHAFSQLSSAEKSAVDFFVWAGCCMHKELNAMKGGNARIRAWWGANAIEGPVLLMNKDNAAATAISDNLKAKERAINVSAGGAQKVLDLAGAIFRHKDSKKGQHDSLRYHMENVLGFRVQWPDTSNTRYHSHGDAACEFLVHEPLYMAYLEQIRLKKDSRTLTNIEENVLRGFSCPKTKEEIICFAAYNQCVTHPYLRTVRDNKSNILELGPVHTNLISHIQKLASNVDLIIGPSATYKTATMDGKPFTRPEAIYAIQWITSDTVTYPHIRRLLASFLEGTMETWIRFSREFASGGKIDGATATQRRSAFMKTTNDDNEGALGTVRTSLRRAPSMSLSHFNSRLMYKKNHTGSYISNILDQKERRALRKKARERDRCGEEQIRREAQAEYDKQLAQKNKELDVRKKERKEAMVAKLESVTPRTTPEAIESMKVAEIDLQLRWHRQFDSEVPSSKNMPKLKAEKVVVLKTVVERYLRGQGVPGESTSKVDTNGGRVDDDGDSEEELY